MQEQDKADEHLTPERRAAMLADAMTCSRSGNSVIRDLAAHVRALDAALAAAEAELKLWKPLTPEEAERAMEAAEAVPLTESEIAAIVKRATDPAERIDNSEQAQLAVRLVTAEAERDQLRQRVANRGEG